MISWLGNTPLWIIALMALPIGILMTTVAFRRERRRSDAFRDWACEKGWTWVEGVRREVPDELKCSILAEKPADRQSTRTYENLMTGEWNGRRTVAFQLNIVVLHPPSATSNNVVYRQISRDVPCVAVRPVERWKWLKKERRDRIQILGESKFNRTFQANCADRAFAAALLTDPVRREMLRAKCVSFEITDHTLAVFGARKRGHPDEMIPLIELMNEIEKNAQNAVITGGLVA